MISVLLVDDHRLVRAGLEQLLENADDIQVVAAAAGAVEAIDRVLTLDPDVVLMDVSMPGVDGIAATREIVAQSPHTRVVMLTSTSDRDRILDAFEAGAVGYLLKDSEPEQLYAGVRAAARGETPLDAKAARIVVGGRREPAGPVLTPRERRILGLVCEGSSNRAIAQQLLVSEKTVKNHLSRMFQAIGVADRTQAALWAQRQQLDRAA